MKLSRVLLALWLMAAAEAHANDAGAPLKVLFIGNSYTYFHRMPDIVAALGKAPDSPRPIEVRMIAQGGASLLQHWENGMARRAIRGGGWDVVVLQEQSLLPLSRPGQLRTYAKRFADEVRAAGGRTVLYVTWARRAEPDTQTQIDKAYEDAAGETGAALARVGPAWQEARKVLRDLPLYDDDGSHPAPLGSYLAACVIYLAVLPEAKACPTLEDADRLDPRALLAREIAQKSRLP